MTILSALTIATAAPAADTSTNHHTPRHGTPAWQWQWQKWLPDKWQRIGACETGYGKRPGRWDWNSGTYQGAFGFAVSSWDAFKKPGYPNEAYLATPWQQYQVALAIYRRYGLSGVGVPGRVRIAGIDYSTKAVDLVTIPYEGDGQPVWHHMPLEGDGAFDRARDVANVMFPRRSLFWDDILAIGIEHPGGKYRDATLRIQGAILSCLPAATLVKDIPPGQWKKHTVGKGNANHAEYISWAYDNGGQWDWNEDACAAYCIALYTRTLITTPRASNIVRDGDTVFG